MQQRMGSWIGGLALATVLAATGAWAAGVVRANAAPVSSTCSWGARSNPDTVNAAYPDTNAYYWLARFGGSQGTRVSIAGRFPAARYFSFHVYGPNGVPVASLADLDVHPDPGSGNPFTGPVAPDAGDTYHAAVVFAPEPKQPAPNTLYASQMRIGAPNAVASMIYRVYVPDDPKSPPGGVPLPKLTLTSADGSQRVVSFDPCSPSSTGAGAGVNRVVARGDYPTSVPAPPIPNASNPPAFTRAGGSDVYGAFPNDQNAYLGARISKQYGQLLVLRGKAPTFPDTRAGDPPYGEWQLRYWSVCENSLATTRVIACAGDDETALRGGSYTYVISAPADRPKNATAANGVTWIPWGAFPDGFLIFRNMLPAPGFRQAIQNVGAKASPDEVMGPYAPRGAYCSTATFEARGWSGCFGSGS